MDVSVLTDISMWMYMDREIYQDTDRLINVCLLSMTMENKFKVRTPKKERWVQTFREETVTL